MSKNSRKKFIWKIDDITVETSVSSKSSIPKAKKNISKKASAEKIKNILELLS